MDDDKHYLRSRRMLISISLVLLIATMGGAKIYEVNTFIFKLGFKHPENLFNILLWAAGFLLIRYYNNSAKYHQQIAESWHYRLTKDPFMYCYVSEADEEQGFLVDLAPTDVPYREHYPAYQDHYPSVSSVKLHTGFLFNATFEYHCTGEHGEMFIRSRRIYKCDSIKDYIKAISLITSHWWDAQLRNNDSPTLYGPYLIALVAIGYAVIPKLFLIYG